MSQNVLNNISHTHKSTTRPSPQYHIKSIGKNGRLRVKIIGTDHIIECYAQDLAHRKIVLSHFDKDDVQYILSIAQFETLIMTNKPRY